MGDRELVKDLKFKSWPWQTVPVAAPNSSINAYMIRAEVELRHDGQAAHKHEAAVDVQQQASYKKKRRKINMTR